MTEQQNPPKLPKSADGVPRPDAPSIEVKDLVSMAIERHGAVMNLWNLWIASAGGVLGVLASGKAGVDPTAQSLLTVLFVVFAASNLGAIHQVAEQRKALCNLVPNGEFQALVEHLRPRAALTYATFHFAIDVVVVGCIWWVKWS